MFWPYLRDPDTLARAWALPGTPDLMHRIGGIEKEDGSGNVSYDSDNHERMVHIRAAKVAGIADDIPRGRWSTGPDDADLLVLGWGSTWGAIDGAVNRVRANGPQGRPGPPHPPQPVPAQPRRGRCAATRGCSCPEMNLGQLSRLVRAEFLVDARSVTKVRGVPFTAGELEVGHPRARLGGHAMTDLIPVTSRKDWSSDQEVRWCPGCGDYSILAAVQLLMPDLGVRREDMAFVSGIGCAARFPYYMNTYGMHSIHGRAPAIATGLAMARPDLHVWVVTGDGDSLSIGGNHLIHALRRNINITILMFNNQIYGLTKGQYSPTSELGKVTKSTPFGSLDHPFNPLSLALGAEASFVARTHDMDRAHMLETFRRAHEHKGSAFVEVFQNCNVFNDARLRGRHGQGGARRHAHPAPPRRADPLRRRGPARRGDRRAARRPHRRGRRRRRGRAARARRGPHRPERGLHALPPGPGPLRAHADRRVPRRRPPRVRLRGEPAARRRGRDRAVRATSPRSSAAASTWEVASR